MAKIKIATPSADMPRFVDGGLVVSSNWAELDLDTITDEQRDSLSQFAGTHIRVHDDDLATFRSWLGGFGAQYDDETRTVKDPQRDERVLQRQQAAAQQERDVARGTSPGRAPVEGQAQSFAQPPSVGERDRAASDTAPDKPSNLNRDVTKDKAKPR